MTFINRNQLIFTLSLLFVFAISFYLVITFGENIIQKQNIKIDTENNNEESVNKIIPLEIDFTFVKSFSLKEGETITSILRKTTLMNNEIDSIIKIISTELDLTKLKIGTQIEINSSIKNGVSFVNEIVIYPDKENKFNVYRVEDKFIINQDTKQLFSKLKLYEVKIDKSIYETLKKLNVPDKTIMEYVQLFSFDIDFQREIRNGNKIKLLYEVYTDMQNNYVKSGEIYYAEISLNNNSYDLYRFNSQDSEFVEYFNSEGKSATKALMKTPINGARLSSGFGMRKHPILGYNKKHQGVDFAAPEGTPIMAAGTGYIEFVGNNGGAGKYIRIKHLNGYKTSYSHLSNYAKGIKKNSKVQQGQIIGFVGNTGLSTGPHLHYEVIFNGKRINPMEMKLPSGKQLKDKNFEIFLVEKNRIDKMILEINAMN